jgi:hypothetical protein
MPRCRLRLTWTTKGADPHHPHSVQFRRDKAVDVAGQNHVTGPNGNPIRNHINSEADGATWIVEGQDTDINNMIATWVGHGNVTVQKFSMP